MARIDTGNRSRYWRDPNTPGLSLLSADFRRHDYAPHTHDALVVAATEAGGSEFKSRGRTEEARATVLLVFNPTEPHSGRMGRSERWRYRGLYLTQETIDAVTALLGAPAPSYFTANVFADADLLKAFLALHRALETPEDDLRARELLVACFGALFRRHGSDGGRIPRAPRDNVLLRDVAGLMRERHAEKLTLEELAGSAGLTPFQLIGLFNRTVGLTPHAYLTQLRLEAAMRHLQARRPIADAAHAAGFYDQSALTRYFKRAFGITPRQYAAAMV